MPAMSAMLMSAEPLQGVGVSPPRKRWHLRHQEFWGGQEDHPPVPKPPWMELDSALPVERTRDHLNHPKSCSTHMYILCSKHICIFRVNLIIVCVLIQSKKEARKNGMVSGITNAKHEDSTGRIFCCKCWAALETCEDWKSGAPNHLVQPGRSGSIVACTSPSLGPSLDPVHFISLHVKKPPRTIEKILKDCCFHGFHTWIIEALRSLTQPHSCEIEDHVVDLTKQQIYADLPTNRNGNVYSRNMALKHNMALLRIFKNDAVKETEPRAQLTLSAVNQVMLPYDSTPFNVCMARASQNTLPARHFLSLTFDTTPRKYSYSLTHSSFHTGRVAMQSFFHTGVLGWGLGEVAVGCRRMHLRTQTQSSFHLGALPDLRRNISKEPSQQRFRKGPNSPTADFGNKF